MGRAARTAANFVASVALVLSAGCATNATKIPAQETTPEFEDLRRAAQDHASAVGRLAEVAAATVKPTQMALYTKGGLPPEDDVTVSLRFVGPAEQAVKGIASRMGYVVESLGTREAVDNTFVNVDFKAVRASEALRSIGAQIKWVVVVVPKQKKIVLDYTRQPRLKRG